MFIILFINIVYTFSVFTDTCNIFFYLYVMRNIVIKSEIMNVSHILNLILKFAQSEILLLTI